MSSLIRPQWTLYSWHDSHYVFSSDTSANLVFEDATIAQEALASFSVTFNGELPNQLQLRTAKNSSTQSTMEIQVRIAVTTDRKPPRAHERSRFYMMHPEHDPREQRRQDSRGRRNSSRRNDRISKRKRSIERNNFDVLMYDDDSDARAKRGRHSRSSFSSNTTRSDSHYRGRSASPGRRTRRRHDRRRSPPPRYARVDPSPAARRENLGKELFPNGGTSANKTAAVNIKKELFPRLKSGTSALHRRTNSIDATHDPTSDALSASLSKMVTPLVDGANDSFPLRSDSINIEQLARPKEKDVQKNGGFSIKGAAKVQDQGFSIKGTADSRVKELFPGKVNNKGKELFVNRERNRADMFY